MSGTSVVEMATAQLERSGKRQPSRTAPKAVQNLQIWYRRRCPKSVGTQTALRNLSNSSLQIVTICSGSWATAAVRKNWEKPDHDAVIVMTQWGYPAASGVPAHPAGGNIYTGGFEWRRMALCCAVRVLGTLVAHTSGAAGQCAVLSRSRSPTCLWRNCQWPRERTRHLTHGLVVCEAALFAFHALSMSTLAAVPLGGGPGGA